MSKLKCVLCDKTLKGRQTRYCSNKCSVKFFFNTPKGRQYQKRYSRSEKHKAAVRKFMKKYVKTDKYKRWKKKYDKKRRRKIFKTGIHAFKFITTDGINNFTPEWKVIEKKKNSNKIVYIYQRKDGSETKTQTIDLKKPKEKWKHKKEWLSDW